MKNSGSIIALVVVFGILILIGIIFFAPMTTSRAILVEQPLTPLDVPVTPDNSLEIPLISRSDKRKLSPMPLIECGEDYHCDCKVLQMQPGRVCTGTPFKIANKDVQMCYRAHGGDEGAISIIGNMICNDDRCKKARVLCKNQVSCQSLGVKCGDDLVASL